MSKSHLIFKFALAIAIYAGINTERPLAQSILQTYEKESIYLFSDARGYWFVKDDVAMPTGFLWSNLKKELTTSKQALLELEIARRHKKVALLAGAISGAIALTETVLAIKDISYSDNRPLFISLIVGSVISGFVSKTYSRMADGAISRAVWIYNRDLINR